jgi:3-hydroxyisobutyrate dehydrogenase
MKYDRENPFAQSIETKMEHATLGNVGFIGLGAMGKHMAAHLAARLPSSSTLYVYDVVSAPVTELIDRFPGVVQAGTSPKDVAQNTVWKFSKCNAPLL